MNKYHAKKIVTDEGVFDSRKEYKRWCDLKMLERAGKISALRRQVGYELIPVQREPDVIGPKGGIKKGKVIEHPCTYKADFVYEEGHKTIVEDVKGMRTPEYIIKRKLMLHVFGIRIKET